MAKKMVLAVGGLLLLLLVIIALRPAAFTVERSLVIAAPPAILYAQIANLRAMDAWSPWAKMDPGMTTRYEGPAAGVGARSAWEGPEMGSGRIEITAAAPHQRVEMRLEMLAPMQATNRVTFLLAPVAQGTQVTWRMQGENGFIGKALSLVMSMDEMVGVEFARGLAALKELAESEAARRAAD